MIHPQVGILTNNKCSPLMTKVIRNLEEEDISYAIYSSARECIDNTDYDKPPRIVLIDNETVEQDYEISGVMSHLNKLKIYCMILTEFFTDKKFVKFLYKNGASDVRPKDHARQIATSITTIFSRVPQR